MTYKIRITEIKKVPNDESTYERIADSGNEKDGKAIYGYVKKPGEKSVEIETLTATADDININEVIAAIFKNN